METETSFGALISRRRKALGLLQKELALQFGCSVTAVQKIERDERRPSRAMAERLADALDVHVDERATLKGPNQPAVVAELMAELANVRLGWEWAAAHAFADELNQAADTLFWLYESQSNCREGVPLFGQAVNSLQVDERVTAAVPRGKLSRISPAASTAKKPMAKGRAPRPRSQFTYTPFRASLSA